MGIRGSLWSNTVAGTIVPSGRPSGRRQVDDVFSLDRPFPPLFFISNLVLFILFGLECPVQGQGQGWARVKVRVRVRMRVLRVRRRVRVKGQVRGQGKGLGLGLGARFRAQGLGLYRCDKLPVKGEQDVWKLLRNDDKFIESDDLSLG